MMYLQQNLHNIFFVLFVCLLQRTFLECTLTFKTDSRVPKPSSHRIPPAIEEVPYLWLLL